MADFGLTRNLGQRTKVKHDKAGNRVGGGTLITEGIQAAAAGDAAGNLVIREDNAAQIAEAIDRALARGLEKVGLVAEGHAKRLCPVDTGRLRNSITHELDLSENSVAIGTNVEYAPYVEYGTSKRAAANGGKGFLRPAANDHAPQYRKIIEDELKNA